MELSYLGIKEFDDVISTVYMFTCKVEFFVVPFHFYNLELDCLRLGMYVFDVVISTVQLFTCKVGIFGGVISII